MEQNGNEGLEIVNISGNQLQPDEKIQFAPDDIIAIARERIEISKQIKIIALKATNENDWISQNGKPYLMGYGIEKVARVFGVSWSFSKKEKTFSKDELGDFYFYTYKGIFSFKNGKETIEVEGTGSSRDKFFAKSKGEWLPSSEVDETNIMKSGQTNCVCNGVGKLLGLRSLIWDDLKEAGLDISKIQKIEYKTKPQDNQSKKENLDNNFEQSKFLPTDPITKKQLSRFWAILYSSIYKDRQEEIKGKIKIDYSLNHIAELNQTQYKEVIEKIEQGEL